MRRIIEQSRVTRSAPLPRVYPEPREFTLDGIAPSVNSSIRCSRVEREAAFDAQARSNAAWLASRPSASTPSASPEVSERRAREARERHETRLQAARDSERARAVERARAAWTPAEIAESLARKDALARERAAWSGVDA